MPKDFSEDGAFGASGGGSQPGSFGSGAASSGNISDSEALTNFGSHALDNGRLGGSFNTPTNMISGAAAAAQFGPGAMGAGNLGFSFAEGGAIGDDTDGSPAQDRISKALDTVDAVLAFGRKLHGLGGNEEDDGAIKGTQTAAAMPTIPGNQSETPGPYKPGQGGQQMAANMPSVPGSQSNSGQRPPQPMPGPLPPTSNPFGKRADAGDGDGDGDSDDQGGAINTEEDTA